MKRSYTADDLLKALRTSTSIHQTLKRLGLSATGSAYPSLKKAAHEYGIDIEAELGILPEPIAPSLRTRFKPIDEILTKGKKCHNLRERLFQEGIFVSYECNECHIMDWNGEPIALQIHHKNGDKTDNRRDNLELLCPNCHTDTSTYAGRNNR